MALAIVPTIHVQEGRIVSPRGLARPEPLRDTVHKMSKAHGRVYVVEMDGLRRNRPDVAILQELARRSTIWVDAGARFATDAMDMLMAGADNVTVRWRLLADRDAALEAAAVAEKMYLAVEFGADGFRRNPDDAAGLEDVLGIAAAEGMGLVVIDTDRAGSMQGVRRDVAFQTRSFAGEKWFAGGVASSRDVGLLEEYGFAGALVSTAILEGRWP